VKDATEGKGLITLLTDFGLKDAYVGALKGVILSINPAATIIDISHDISPQNILQGAFILSQAAPYFPKDTIHVAVIDPGVGTSSRRPILVETSRYLFVGPDNGMFGLVLQSEKIRKVIYLSNREFFLKDMSRTFHGRDVFAPVAAYLSLGVNPATFGKKGVKIKKHRLERPRVNKGVINGTIIHIDRFGNVITNIQEELITPIKPGAFILKVGDKVIKNLVGTYGNAKRGETVALIGSSGVLEIAKRDGSAALELSVDLGQSVTVKIGTLLK
jgi:hypothetical protein